MARNDAYPWCHLQDAELWAEGTQQPRAHNAQGTSLAGFSLTPMSTDPTALLCEKLKCTWDAAPPEERISLTTRSEVGWDHLGLSRISLTPRWVKVVLHLSMEIFKLLSEAWFANWGIATAWVQRNQDLSSPISEQRILLSFPPSRDLFHGAEVWAIAGVKELFWTWLSGKTQLQRNAQETVIFTAVVHLNAELN